MKKVLIGVCLFALCAGSPCHARPKRAKRAVSHAQRAIGASPAATYTKRVASIVRDMIPSLKVLDDAIEGENARLNMESGMMRDTGDMNINSRLQMAKEMAALHAHGAAQRNRERLAAIAKIRPQLVKLQKLSPVPRSMALADRHLANYCLAMNRALDGFKSHIYRPDLATFRQAESDYSQATDFLDAASRELEKAKATGFKGKTYVPG